MWAFDYVTQPGTSLQLSCRPILQNSATCVSQRKIFLLQPPHNNVQVLEFFAAFYDTQAHYNAKVAPEVLEIFASNIGLIATLLSSINLISSQYWTKV